MSNYNYYVKLIVVVFIFLLLFNKQTLIDIDCCLVNKT